MKSLLLCLVVLFFSYQAIGQVSKIEFSNLKAKKLNYSNFFIADEKHAYLIGLKRIVEISDSTRELKINPKVKGVEYIDENLYQRLSRVFDSTHFKLYTLEETMAYPGSSIVKLTCLDLKNPMNSSQILYSNNLKDIFKCRFFLSLNEGKITLFHWSEKSIKVSEVDAGFTGFNLLSTEEIATKNVYLFNDEMNAIYRAEMEKSDDLFQFTFYKYEKNTNLFERIGTETITLQPKLFTKKNEFITQPNFAINHLNNQQLVISFSGLLERLEYNGTLGNRFREHYIYECDLEAETYLEKIVSEKSVLSHFVPDLEVIFQNSKIVYLEKSVIQNDYKLQPLTDKSDQISYYRMEYWFDDELNYEIKLHPYRMDMLPWLDDNLNDELCAQIDLPKRKIKQNATKLHESSLYVSSTELVSYRFAIGTNHNVHFGYFYVFKTPLED